MTEIYEKLFKREYVLRCLLFVFAVASAMFLRPQKALAADTATLLGGNSGNNRAAVSYNTANAAYELYFELDIENATTTAAGTATCHVSGVEPINSMACTIVIPSEIAVDLSSLGPEYSNKNFEVVSVAAGAFKGYQYISAVVLPNTVNYLGNYAFYGCTNLTSITFSDGITGIGTECFYGCTALKGNTNNEGELLLPRNLATVGSGAFGNCPLLSNLNAGNCTDFCNINNDGILYQIETSASYRLVQCPAGSAIKELEIKEPVFAIDPEAFIYCTKLKKVDIKDSVRSIREKAFYGCSSLESVILPNDVTMSGEDIFDACNSLKSIVVYSSSTGNALSYCTANKYPVQTHCIVKFYDGTTLLSTQDIIYGGSATAPLVQPKAGYTLTWDTDYKNVKTDLTVKTVWRQNYTVIFQDTAHGWKTSFEAYYGETITPPVWTLDGYALSWDTDAYQYVTKDTTVNAVWLVSMTDVPIDKDTSNGVYDSVGDVFTVGKIKYEVTKFVNGDKRVAVLACTDKKASKIVIPATVTAGGNSYKVTAIGKNVFKNMTSLKKAVVGKNVVAVGKKAFYGCTSLEKLIIRTRQLTSDGVAIRSFGKVNTDCIVKVPTGYVKKYAFRLRDGGMPSSVRIKAIKS